MAVAQIDERPVAQREPRVKMGGLQPQSARTVRQRERGDEAGVDAHRRRLEDRSDPQHFMAIERESDYLTVMNLLFKSISQILADRCSLTTLQYRMLLRLLSAEGGTLRTTDLADNLRVSASTVSAAVPHLVDERLVVRAEDPNDMRVVSLSLTKAGAAEIEKADFHVGEFLQCYWRNLTPEQLEAAFASSTNAVTLHNATRIENGTFRLDTAFFDTVMISRTLTSAKLAGYGLKTPEYRILVALRILGLGTTASQVAKYLFLKSSDVTTPLKSLEAKGLISKERNADNRRTKSLGLTQQGWDLVEDLAPIVYDALLETCHSNEDAVQIHLGAARDVVARERGAALFS